MKEFSLPEQTPCILKDPTCAGLAIDATCPRCGQQGLSQSLLETTGYTAFQEAFAWRIQNEQALATQYVALEKTLATERQNQTALQKKLTTQAAELEKTLTKERQAQANREAALQKKLTAQSAELEKTLTKERQNQAALQKALEEIQQAYLKLEQEKTQLFFSQAWHKIKTFTGHDDHHEDYVRSVGYSPCGKYVVSGSDDHTVKIWEVATGQCVQTLTGHTDWVQNVGYSPCGKYVVSGSRDKTVKLWEVATGQCVQTLTGHEDWVRSVGYSPCGKYVVSGSRDKTVKLWEVATGQCVQTLTGHTHWVMSVGYSPCGKYVVSGSWDETLKLWEVTTGQCVQTLTGHEDSVLSVGYSPCGKYVVSGSRDETVRLWEVATGQCVQTLTGHTSITSMFGLQTSITSAGYSSCGKYVVSGSDDETVKLWEVATGACLRTFQMGRRIKEIAYAPSGHTFIVGVAGQYLEMWGIADRVDV